MSGWEIFTWLCTIVLGLGFGIEGSGGGGFFDYAINSTFQLHFFGSSMNQKQESLFGTNSVETNSSIGGLTLRMFPSDASGFFFGFGGGGFSINQTVNQNITDEFNDYQKNSVMRDDPSLLVFR